MNFLLRTPFFRLLLALIAGIVTSRYFRLYDLTFFSFAVMALMVVTLSFVVHDIRWSYRLRWGFGAGVVVLVYLLGYVLMNEHDKQLHFDFAEQPLMYRLQIVGQPEIKERSVLAEAVPELCSELEKPTPVEGWRGVKEALMSVDPPRVLVYIRKDSTSASLRRGDVILARVRFQSPQPVQNPEGFDYSAYLRTRGIAATAFVDSTEWRHWSVIRQSSVLHWAELARDHMLMVYRKLELNHNEFAVLSALTLGYKEELEPDLMAHYSASGAMHVLSVSGLHVGVIFLIVNSLLSLVFRRPSTLVLKTIFMVLVLWLYAFITGLSPSVVRASAMFSMVAVGKALDRHAQIYNTISSTGFILLIYNPAYLYDVGFQLSYSAVIGIVYFQPKISPLLTVSNKALKWLWDLTSVSLAAQIGTLPLSLYYFNQFPNYFLLTNYIAIPLSTFIIYAAVAYLGVSFIPHLNEAVGWLLDWLLFALNSSIALIHNLPGSVSQVYAGPLQLALMGVVLCCFVGYAELKKYLFLPVGMGAVVVYLWIQGLLTLQNLRTERIIYWSDRKESHLLLARGSYEWVHTTDSSAFVKQAGKYRLKHDLKNQDFRVHEHSFVTQFNRKRIAVVNDTTYRRRVSSTPLAVDYLIVQQFKGQRVDQLMRCFLPDRLIVGAGVSEYYTQQFRNWCKVHKKRFYATSESGAYVELQAMEN